MSRIYLGRIANHTTERDIERFFKSYGRIREIVMKTGYAFVEFDDRRDAEDARYDLNGKEMCGERVTVEIARAPNKFRDGGGRDGGGRFGGRPGRFGGGGGGGRERSSGYGPPTRTDYRLIVENLSSRVSWQDLKDLMRKVGDVTYADAHKQRSNEGIVEFKSRSDMEAAMEKFDDYEMCGRRIRLRKESSGGGGGGRSRSRTRSESRSRSRSRGRRGRSASRSRSRSRSRSPKRQSKERTRSSSRGSDKAKNGGAKAISASPRSRSPSRGRDSPVSDGEN